MRTDEDTTRKQVRDRYAGIATEQGDDCCAGSSADEAAETAKEIGYDDEDLDAAGEGNMGLGCGNPSAIAGLEPGETVLDLGSGGGFDCFLAAREVGSTGRVIGVDMTPEMIDTARENARENDHGNVEFRLGEIEHLPVADDSVDVIISNCVVNLSPAKGQVLTEAYRVLDASGYLTISDVVRTDTLPEGVREDHDALAACLSGAEPPETIERFLSEAGFTDITIETDPSSRTAIDGWHDDYDLGSSLVSATIEAHTG
jgi:SAM-dependent methyltransferase